MSWDKPFPADEAEAASLRPYIPAETMQQIDELALKAQKKDEANMATRSRLNAELELANKEAREARQRANRLKKEIEKVPIVGHFDEVYAAKNAAWQTALETRDAARAAGETPRYETAQQAAYRCKAVKEVAA